LVWYFGLWPKFSITSRFVCLLIRYRTKLLASDKSLRLRSQIKWPSVCILCMESATHSERAGGGRRARNSQRWVAAACMKTRGTRRRRPRWVLAARAGRLAPVYSTTPHTPPVYTTPPVFILFTHLDFGGNSPLSLSVPLEVGPSVPLPPVLSSFPLEVGPHCGYRVWGST